MNDRAIERSGELFDSGFYCAESVLQAIAESKGIQSELIPKIATGFCSGMSRTSRTCGAVSGAILALGLFFGRSSPEVPVDSCYDQVQKLIRIFEGKFGSTNCGELTGCDLGTEEGQEAFRANNVIERCREFTVEATSMALSLIG